MQTLCEHGFNTVLFFFQAIPLNFLLALIQLCVDHALFLKLLTVLNKFAKYKLFYLSFPRLYSDTVALLSSIWLQACRGDKPDDGVEVADECALGRGDERDEGIMRRIPVEADFLMTYSVVPGKCEWPLKLRLSGSRCCGRTRAYQSFGPQYFTCFVLIYCTYCAYTDRLPLVAQRRARLVVHPGAVLRARALRRRAAPARPALDDDARLPPRGLRVRV